ncbi:MAG: 4-hydroxy-tetrahydrodipicolinate reductase [Cytophagales bacterium]|jgi:4-hydroxy-tetrahydrodipicolinate reductase|nr:4-hydroxy-tetrahydrodipicolinate reductase [Cytophagales bacterium]
MNIIILGYGKMGRIIEQVALSRGHRISHKINADNLHEMAQINPAEVDAAIEFSEPGAVISNLYYCFDNRIPVVCGTTGWLDRRAEVELHCMQKNAAFFYSSNYSLGVNIFFHLNKVLARLMNRYPEYDVTIDETHHTEKKDAPSGTALTLAGDLLDELDRKTNWVNNAAKNGSELAVLSHRVDKVPGTHVVRYTSAIDDIEIKHTAHNREGFALGAVLAAEWIVGKHGVFSMEDMLEF